MHIEKTLEIDAGNSAVKWRLVEGRDVHSRGRVSYLEVLESVQDILSSHSDLSVVRVVSVAGVAFDRKLAELVQSQQGVAVNFAAVSSPVAGTRCAYDDLSQLGVDRWMAVLAALSRADGATMVVDMGSALTIDLVDAHRQHIGGYIIPGWGLMRLSLENGTQIDHDRIPNDYSAESIEPGCSTYDAIGMGRLKAISAVIESVYAEFSSVQGGVDVNLVCTGGDSTRILSHLSVPAVYVEDLVLDGLAIALQ